MKKEISREDLDEMTKEYMRVFKRGYAHPINTRETVEEAYEKMRKAIETGVPVEPAKMNIAPGAIV